MAVVHGQRGDLAAGTHRSSPYVVQYRQVADPRRLRVLYWAWAAFLVPYLVLRVAWVNWHNFLGPTALALESVTLLLTITCNYTTRRLFVPVHRPVELSRFVVDCLIPTHMEDVALIEPTIIAAQKVRGVRHVMLLGNFEREEVRELCRRLGIGYFPRGTNEFAKAGNLNNGLRNSDADFVMVLDADHMPRPDFLERMMGYFDDPRIAYVQAPQTYYNTESFLFRRQHGREGGWTELQPFYQCHQLGKNGWEASLFIGSTAVLRRSALDEIGGFATGTPTEDLHTSLRLHARGWKAVYTPEPLAFGLEAGNLKEYHNQRHRWAAGTLNLLFLSPDSPLRTRGMDRFTRVNFLYGICAHLSGLMRLGFLLIPLLMLLTRQNPVNIPYWFYGPVFALWYALSVGLSHVLNRGTSDVRYSDAYSFGSMFALITGTKGLFIRIRHFASSRKVVLRRDSHWAKWALWSLVGLTVVALARAAAVIATDGLSALLFWGSLFAVIQGVSLVAFLLHLERFERSTTRAEHAVRLGEEKYHYVMDRLAAGEIGPPDPVLNRPLLPTAASRPPRHPRVSWPR